MRNRYSRPIFSVYITVKFAILLNKKRKKYLFIYLRGTFRTLNGTYNILSESQRLII